jgi:hypothetical protein
MGRTDTSEQASGGDGADGFMARINRYLGSTEGGDGLKIYRLSVDVLLSSGS